VNRTLWTCEKLLSRKGMDGRRLASSPDEAVLVSSLTESGLHAPCIDIDYPTTLDDDGLMTIEMCPAWRKAWPYFEPSWQELEKLLSSLQLINGCGCWRSHRTLAIDWKVPVRFVASSNPVHGHLYIDAEIQWMDYAPILASMRDVGLLEVGFVDASISREMTMLLKPGLTKDDLAERGIAIESYSEERESAHDEPVEDVGAEVVF
jgi:hypothetical protein